MSLRTKALVIAPNSSSSKRLLYEISSSMELDVVRTSGEYPGSESVSRLMQAPAPDVVVLDCGDFEGALTVSSRIEKSAPGIPIIAVHAPAGADNLLRLLRAGVREIIEAPVTAGAVAQALANLAHN